MAALVILSSLILVVLILSLAAFWVWMLIDSISNNKLDNTARAIWAFVIIFTGLIGAIIYFFAGRSPKMYPTPQLYQSREHMQPQPDGPAAATYRAYQEGYRPHDPPSVYPERQQIFSEQAVSESQAQYEQIQISYPEESSS